MSENSIVVKSVWIQCVLPGRYYTSEDDFLKMTEKIKRGDIVGVEGYPGNSVWSIICQSPNLT